MTIGVDAMHPLSYLSAQHEQAVKAAESASQEVALMDCEPVLWGLAVAHAAVAYILSSSASKSSSGVW